METTPKWELEERNLRLQRRMASSGLDAVFIVQNADLFYFTGTVQEGLLFIGCEGPPLFLVRRSYERAVAESALEHIQSFQSLKEAADLVKGHGLRHLKRVGLELDVLPVIQYQRLERVFPGIEFVDASPIIRQVRAVKSPYEIGLMREAADICDIMACHLREIVKEGMTEIELAADIEAEARRSGHQGFVRFRRFNHESFYGHLLAGENGAIPAYIDASTGGRGPSPAFGQGAGNRRIQAYEPILLDYPGAYKGYLADQSRLFAIRGLPDDLVRAYDVTLEIYNEILQRIRPGARSDDIYKAAVALAEKLGYQEFFMNYGAAQVSYIGHGVGTEIDEFPFLARGFEMTLEEGMTIAIEPKLVFPGRGVIGIEDTILINREGCESLTFSDRELGIL